LARAFVNAGPDLRRTRSRDGEREHRVEEEARGGDRRDGQHDRDPDWPAQHMKGMPVQDMGLQVEQGNPDPHRRQDLDQREAPAGEQQLDPLEQHDESADAEGKGGQQPPGLAQPDYRLLHGRFVTVANSADQPFQLYPPGGPARPRRHRAVRGRRRENGSIRARRQRRRLVVCVPVDGHREPACPAVPLPVVLRA
jgi:hypothetical protein